jgi:hypothetical protein
VLHHRGWVGNAACTIRLGVLHIVTHHKSAAGQQQACTLGAWLAGKSTPAHAKHNISHIYCYVCASCCQLLRELRIAAASQLLHVAHAPL